MKLIVFSHANSFPAATYSVLFGHLRSMGYTVAAIDKFGHDPRYPVSSNWPHLVRQLHDFAQAQTTEHGCKAFLVGHSLGGFLSTMVASAHPQLARGLVLLDSPLVGGWKASALALAKYSGLVGSMSPGSVSKGRRNRWANVHQVMTHFQSKKAFAAFDPQVLRDYVHGCTHDEHGQRVLSFDRAVETAIYNTFAHNLQRLLRRQPLQCPAAFIGGDASAEMAQVGLTMTRRIVGAAHMTTLPGSHLFPMESPVRTAQAIDSAIASMA